MFTEGILSEVPITFGENNLEKLSIQLLSKYLELRFNQ
jgi:hypothetical protein